MMQPFHKIEVIALLSTLGLMGLACSDSGSDEAESALFPEDFAQSYVKVHDCRRSIEHDLSQVEVYADPTSADRYLEGSYPFAAGSVVVKVEYADDDCTELLGYTAMQRAREGEPSAMEGWFWQHLDKNRKSLHADPNKCVACHSSCSDRDFTCTEP
jgi:hypothetical protein